MIKKTLAALLGLVVLAMLSAIFAPSASAAVLIELKAAHQNQTAEGFGETGDAFIPGTNDPAPTDKDAWHFVIPGGQENEFITLRAEFKTPAGETEFVTSTTFQDPQKNQAYVLTPPGWTLIDANADATGGEEIVLSHTRPATTVTPPVDECEVEDTDPNTEGCQTEPPAEECEVEDMDPNTEGCQITPPVETCEENPNQEKCDDVTPPVKDCTDEDYAAEHEQECKKDDVTPPAPKDCTDAEYADANPAECKKDVVTPPVDNTPKDDTKDNTVVTPPAATVTVPTATVLAATGGQLPHTGASLAVLAAAGLITLAGASLTAISRKANA